MNKYLCAFCAMLRDDTELDSEFVLVEAESMIDAAVLFVEQEFTAWMKEPSKPGEHAVFAVDHTCAGKVYRFDVHDFGHGPRATLHPWLVSGDAADILGGDDDAAKLDVAMSLFQRR